ncbi:TetR/AcrR family transcriptional regulator [Nocardioides sp. InS609-2]|uniref:TetR/AcrR family transcriptional regulator n=1 Tax=Nocardioides sp. InS609-2 TaxID=2760705 RepID=UPI0020BEF98B|nr:TetR/AcrR family transcriptional regulator [Nocardioides sp. InS609-2]
MPEPSRSDISPRRRAILEAAQAVVAEQGLRGLTHRAVDRAAGLPEGSTSAYLRTRKALQLALAEYVVGQHAMDVEALSVRLTECQGDPVRAADVTGDLFRRWLHDRDRLVARLELTLESVRDDELSELLATARGQLVETVDQALATAGKMHDATRAETVVAALDGVLLGGLLKSPRQRPAYLQRSLTQVFASLNDAPATTV